MQGVVCRLTPYGLRKVSYHRYGVIDGHRRVACLASESKVTSKTFDLWPSVPSTTVPAHRAREACESASVRAHASSSSLTTTWPCDTKLWWMLFLPCVCHEANLRMILSGWKIMEQTAAINRRYYCMSIPKTVRSFVTVQQCYWSYNVTSTCTD